MQAAGLPMYSHRGSPQVPAGTRLPDLLNELRDEFQTVVHERNVYKQQKEDFERKLEQQLRELSQVQTSLYELETQHLKVKQQYEDEINRLRRQAQSGVPNPGQPVTFDGGAGSLTLDKQRFAQGPMGGGLGQIGAPAGAGVPQFGGAHTGALTQAAAGVAAAPRVGGKRGRDDSSFYSGLPPLSGLDGENKQQKTADNATAGGLSMPGLTTNGNNNATAVDKVAAADLSAAPGSPVESRAGGDTDKAGAAAAAVAGTATTAAAATAGTKPATEARRAVNGVAIVPGRERVDDKGAMEVDWIVGRNPSVQTNLNIELSHNLEHQSVVCCVKFSNDGKFLATGCNRTAQIFDAETGKLKYTLSDPSSAAGLPAGSGGDLYIRSACFSPDGKFLVTGAEDKTVKVWDIATQQISQRFQGHGGDIYSLDFSSDNRHIVSGSGDKKAKIWDLETGKCLYTLGNNEPDVEGVTSVAYSPNGNFVAAGSLDNVVRLWNARDGTLVERFEGHLDSVYCVAFSPDGKTLASGSLDKTLKLWDLGAGARNASKCLRTFQGHKDFVLSVAFSPDGNWLISGSKDRSVQFWDPQTAVTHMMLQGHENSVISVSVNPLGATFATGSGDARTRVWRYNSSRS